MNEIIPSTIDFLRGVLNTTSIKTSRPLTDLLQDRLVQACTEPTLLAAAQRLLAAMGCDAGWIGGKRVAPFLAACGGPDAPRMLAWLRRHPNVAAMIAGLRKEEDQALEWSSTRTSRCTWTRSWHGCWRRSTAATT